MTMRSFLTFLTEARSRASKRAKELGLTGNGHGGWEDNEGNLVAMTVKGDLEFVKGKEPKEEEEPVEKGSVPEQEPTSNKVPGVDPENTDTPQQEEPAPVPKDKGTLTVAFGRFNPPTIGHEKLINTVSGYADDNDYIIIPSRSEDKKKNPLDVDTKVSIMRQMYPQHAEKIVNDPHNRTIFDVMRKAHNDGYAGIRIVGGGDRVKEYEKLANAYNGSTYQFDEIDVVNAGDRDPDAEGAEGMSASKMRKAAADNDFASFRKGMPKTLSNDQMVSIYTQVQKSMGVTPKEAVIESWEVAPRLYPQELREAYIQNEIYNIGDTVSHDTTGMVGKIVRKGTNHLICVTESEEMFKTWTQDVSPADLKPQPAISTPKEREVGTDSLRSFLQRLTPGEKEQSFINKHKK